MHWENLIKLVTSSSKIMLSILIASILCLILPNYIEQFPAVPEKYRFIVAMIAIASFVMVVISIINWSFQLIKEFPKVILKYKKLNDIEFLILEFLGRNLSRLDTDINLLSANGISNLQIHVARDSLKEQGLIQTSMMDSDIIYITKVGRDRLTKELAKRAP